MIASAARRKQPTDSPSPPCALAFGRSQATGSVGGSGECPCKIRGTNHWKQSGRSRLCMAIRPRVAGGSGTLLSGSYSRPARFTCLPHDERAANGTGRTPRHRGPAPWWHRPVRSHALPAHLTRTISSARTTQLRGDADEESDQHPGGDHVHGGLHGGPPDELDALEERAHVAARCRCQLPAVAEVGAGPMLLGGGQGSRRDPPGDRGTAVRGEPDRHHGNRQADRERSPPRGR